MVFRILTLLIFCSVLSACSNKVKVLEKVKVFDYYDSQEENLQLSKDIFSYNYFPGLLNALDNPNQHILKGITWEQFIRDSDGEISVRLWLNLKNPYVAAKKSKITEYFQNEVDKNYKFHTENHQLFAEALAFSDKIYSALDRGEYLDVWDSLDQRIADRFEKEHFIEGLKRGATQTGKVVSRTGHTKNYHADNIEGHDVRLFFIIHESEYENSKAYDEIVLAYNGGFKLVGIHSKAR